MITKQRLKSRPICKVTFELSPEYDADSLALVADATGWKPVPFQRLKNGKWKLQLEVEPGQQLEFRYRGTTGDETWWDNDPDADRYVPNPFGTSNAVVHC